jgi:hypothetical protein
MVSLSLDAHCLIFKLVLIACSYQKSEEKSEKDVSVMVICVR